MRSLAAFRSLSSFVSNVVTTVAEVASNTRAYFSTSGWDPTTWADMETAWPDEATRQSLES